MAKLLDLDTSWLMLFRENLDGGFALGRLVAQAVDFDKGTLRVFVPEDMGSLAPQRLRHSLIGLDESFDVFAPVCQYFDQFCAGDPSKLVIADTYRKSVEPGERIDVPWFLLYSPDKGGSLQVCAFLRGDQVNPESDGDLLNEASNYPPANVVLKSGDYLAPTSPIPAILIRNVEHVLIGVFDDTSYMVWSR